MRNWRKRALKHAGKSLKTVAKELRTNYIELSRKNDFKSLNRICDHLGLKVVVIVIDPKSGDIV